jgi:hypothetical protein
MNRMFVLIAVLVIFTSAGCNSDIVCTEKLKELDERCIYIEPIECDSPYVGKVLRDVLEKEFIRDRFEICDQNSATVFITGSTFMTTRFAKNANKKSAAANESVESVSLCVKDKSGQILMTASYDNKNQYTVSKLAKEFGSTISAKLK